MPLPSPSIENVRTPATRLPGFCSFSFHPRSIPINRPAASAVTTDNACQYQAAFNAPVRD